MKFIYFTIFFIAILFGCGSPSNDTTENDYKSTLETKTEDKKPDPMEGFTDSKRVKPAYNTPPKLHDSSDKSGSGGE